MTLTIYQRIQLLVETTSDAFTSTGSVNMDYADFASLVLPEFRRALQRPHLTKDELIRLLRTGALDYTKSAPKTDWATFISAYVSQAANMNAANVNTDMSVAGHA